MARNNKKKAPRKAPAKKRKGNSKSESLLHRGAFTTLGGWDGLWEREKRLIGAVLILAVVMNIPWGRFILYPFLIFSTWAHEMCHAIAALMVGGTVDRIEIHTDTQGICYWSSGEENQGTVSNLKSAFVHSAGYTGTAYLGCLMLLFRRTHRGPKFGTIGIGSLMLASCAFFIRDQFGLLVIIPFALILITCGIVLVGRGLGTLFSFLAATCCLNTLLDIHYIFSESDVWDENHEDNAADAMAVAEAIGGTYFFWTLLWYIQAVMLLLVGLLLPLHPKEKDGIVKDENAHPQGLEMRPPARPQPRPNNPNPTQQYIPPTSGENLTPARMEEGQVRPSPVDQIRHDNPPQIPMPSPSIPHAGNAVAVSPQSQPRRIVAATVATAAPPIPSPPPPPPQHPAKAYTSPAALY